ncbi:hypothetical protein S245_014531 [Arachis hypogaea]
MQKSHIHNSKKKGISSWQIEGGRNKVGEEVDRARGGWSIAELEQKRAGARWNRADAEERPTLVEQRSGYVMKEQSTTRDDSQRPRAVAESNEAGKAASSSCDDGSNWTKQV